MSLSVIKLILTWFEYMDMSPGRRAIRFTDYACIILVVIFLVYTEHMQSQHMESSVIPEKF